LNTPGINHASSAKLITARRGTRNTTLNSLPKSTETEMNGFENTGWICSDWETAHEFNDWRDVCNSLYGACQACISTGSDDYEDYKTLLLIAREHRFNARSAE
jgi:hypothetical protein